ncbi:UPF0051 protein ABCI8, chloroplastic [Vitis vinifera]|uniref:UPF0051 protein ABCI8, chloroplastic n=1 Tax=Vitis vinifera TaxID=29760 RepID=A0A438JG98_VITVI|nr:UPF0051 protein ABCI8, chloroplastic [Vitis vinifera]
MCGDDLLRSLENYCIGAFIIDPLVKNPTARIEHEASTSKIGEDQLFYFQQRGIDYEKAMAAMISGFCKDVFNELPDEFGAEVNQLMSLKLEGSVG